MLKLFNSLTLSLPMPYEEDIHLIWFANTSLLFYLIKSHKK